MRKVNGNVPIIQDVVDAIPCNSHEKVKLHNYLNNIDAEYKQKIKGNLYDLNLEEVTLLMVKYYKSGIKIMFEKN